MLTVTVGSTLLLLASASAVAAQESVVSEIPSSLIQTTEQVFTIQTSVPTGTTTPCYVVCVKEPCYACSATASDGQMSLPVESLPVPSTTISDGNVTMVLPVESLPPVGSEATPSVTGILTHPLLPPISQTTDLPMSIPQGETPESTGILATSSASGNLTVSASRSAPPEQTTAAAPPSLMGDSTPFNLAVGISALSVLFGAAWTLL